MRSWRRPTLAAGAIASAALVATACSGTWQVTATPSPIKAVHVALLHTGKVLMVAGSGNSRGDFDAGTFKTSIWDPTTGTFSAVTTPWDAFCSGHSFLPDGELLVAGGTTAYPGPATNNANAGSAKSYLFDPDTKQYVAEPDMATARWYPTTIELGSGNIFTVGGLDDQGLRTNASQTFNANLHTWTADKVPPSQLSFMPFYPSLHLLSDGRVFYSGVNVFGPGPTAPGIWNVNTNAWTAVSGLTDPGRRDQGMSVLLPPAQDQKVMVMGGGFQDQPVDAVSSTAIVDLRSATPTFVPGPPMDTKKMYVSAVILPDSTVLETGGASTTVHNGDHAVLSAQIFDPKTSAWTKVASPTVPRVYHSSALLLPDGRVATFGGNPDDGYETRIEIFTPPYLQQGTARPTIDAAPTEMTYGGTYSLRTTQAAALRSAVLVRPMAVTHSSDPAQRLVDLPFTTTANGASVTVTNSRNIAPPGWYMVFVVDGNGVPSVAKWIHLS
ncbi:MAG TPA: galactose oxidase-like domain-containing protein [Acidimicrobiia bacterium]